MKKIGIIGSRDFNDYEVMEKTIDMIVHPDDITHIISGGSRGADRLGEKYATKHGIMTKIYAPQWVKFGKGAGMIRNSDIIQDSDFVFIFWDGISKGTADSISLCHKYKVPYIVVFFENPNDNSNNKIENFLKE